MMQANPRYCLAYGFPLLLQLLPPSHTCKVVLRPARVMLLHDSVPRHFGNHAGRSDAVRLAVTLDDRAAALVVKALHIGYPRTQQLQGSRVLTKAQPPALIHVD